MSRKSGRKATSSLGMFPDQASESDGINHEPQTLFTLCLDCTSSQKAGWSNTLRGVQGLLDTCKAHPATRSSTRVSVALCGPEVSATPYGPFSATALPEASLVSGSPGSLWIRDLVERLRKEHAQLKADGVPVNKDIALLMSDFWFDDLDSFDASVELYRTLEAEHANFTGFIVMTGSDPNRSLAARISKKRPPVHLDDLKVAALFQWVSEAVMRASTSRPGERVTLPTPTWTLNDGDRN